jgi:hypothetical protein
MLRRIGAGKDKWTISAATWFASLGSSRKYHKFLVKASLDMFTETIVAVSDSRLNKLLK